MPSKIRMWEVTEQGTLNEVTESGINLERRLEDWLESDIPMLDPNLLVIGRQVLTDFGGEIDLLCLDREGSTVVVVLKRGKTPRDVTAQALDYASWVKDLSYQQISDLADRYFGSEGSLEDAFGSKFEVEFPETLSLSHRVLVVAEAMDDSTERIVRYLSEMGVPINVATVQHFKDNAGKELLAQVFLVEPEVAEVRAQSNSKKRNLPTVAQMIALAEERGVGDFYRQLVAGSSGIMTNASFGNTSRGFSVKDESKLSAVFVVELGESDADKGLTIRLNGTRLMKLFRLSSEQLDAMLPAERAKMDANDWRGATDEEKANWVGCRCYFRSPEEIDKFIAGLKNAQAPDRGD